MFSRRALLGILPLVNVKSKKTVGVLPASSPCAPEISEKATAYLENEGFRVLAPLHPSANYSSKTALFSAGSITERLEAFQKVLKCPDLLCILLARGGYGSMEILQGLHALDFPKDVSVPVFGFSDSTALLLALEKQEGILPVHGLSFSSLAVEETRDSARKAFKKFLSFEKAKSFQAFEEATLQRLSAERSEIEGTLRGGNLTLICSLIGTPWEPNFDDAILFFEDVNVKPYALHRLLLQLKLAGKLEKLRAVIVGDMLRCEAREKESPGLLDVLEHIFTSTPLFLGAPFGHGARNAILPLGCRATLQKDNSLEVFLSADSISSS